MPVIDYMNTRKLTLESDFTQIKIYGIIWLAIHYVSTKIFSCFKIHNFGL